MRTVVSRLALASSFALATLLAPHAQAADPPPAPPASAPEPATPGLTQLDSSPYPPLPVQAQATPPGYPPGYPPPPPNAAPYPYAPPYPYPIPYPYYCPYPYPAPGAAQPPAQPTAPRRSPSLKKPTERVSFGHEIIFVDGISAGLMLLGVLIAEQDKQDAGASVAAVGAFGYALGPPVLHWSHGQGAGGFASFGLRAGLPFVGGLVGAGACGITNEQGGCTPAVVGAIAGAVSAVVLDTKFLANYEAPRAGALRFAPTASAAPGRASLGLVGSW